MLIVHGLVKDECESLMGMMMTTYDFGRKKIDKNDKKNNEKMLSSGDRDHVKAEESERRREDSQESCSTGGWTGKDHDLISLPP